MDPEDLGSHELAEELNRLQRRAHRHLAHNEISHLPEDKKTRKQNESVAKGFSFVILHQRCPRLESSTFSQWERKPFATIENSRISRMRGYIVALSKFV